MNDKKIFSNDVTPRAERFRTNAPARPTPDPRIQAIKEAYKEGLLIAHMLEFPIFRLPTPQLTTMLNVMAGVKGTLHKGYCDGDEQNIYKTTPFGMRGIATTLLSAEHKGNLWTNMSKVGFLFDGNDDANIRLERFYPVDAQSRVKNDKVMYDADFTPLHLGEELFAIVNKQFNSPEKLRKAQNAFKKLHFSDQDDRTRHELTKQTILDFWQARKDGKLPDYEETCLQRSPEKQPLINETTISAKLAGIKAIVIHSSPKSQAMSNDFSEAEWLATWISKTHPETFPEKLPVVVYDGRQLHEAKLYKKQLQQQHFNDPTSQSGEWRR